VEEGTNLLPHMMDSSLPLEGHYGFFHNALCTKIREEEPTVLGQQTHAVCEVWSL
jgi:hypothetical protein